MSISNVSAAGRTRHVIYPPTVYVASRASIAERAQMWRDLRDRRGARIISSWIDESGEGQTEDFGILWARIVGEIGSCDRFVIYAEAQDFPLKGVLVEAGVALALDKPVWILGKFSLEARTDRPIGSWIRHPLVQRVNVNCQLCDVEEACGL